MPPLCITVAITHQIPCRLYLVWFLERKYHFSQIIDSPLSYLLCSPHRYVGGTEAMGQESAFHRFTTQPLEVEQQPPQQQPLPDFSAPSELADDGAPAAPPKPPFKRKLTRIIAIALALSLAIALY